MSGPLFGHNGLILGYNLRSFPRLARPRGIEGVGAALIGCANLCCYVICRLVFDKNGFGYETA